MKLRREQPNGANAPLVDIDVASYRVAQGSAAGLINRPTRIAPLHNSDHAYQAQLADHIDRLGKLQQRFYAADRYALLVIIQGMDAAGKDGTIAHVMSGINPQGCDVFSFKQPSQEELQHDFLWRSNRNLPERGKIGIFNRSYYEEVVILRVHPAMLDAEGLAGALGLEHEFWVQRYRSINAPARLAQLATIKAELVAEQGKQGDNVLT